MPNPGKSPGRKTAPRRLIKKEAEGLLAGYSAKERPLGGYAILVGLFTVALASGLAASEEWDEGQTEPGWSDLLLLGIATHKLSRIVAKDLVTSPFRAPFVKFKQSAGAGEVEEEARGEGIQEAIGDLITCPYCIGPWIASALVFGFQRAPRATRMIGGIFAIAAGSDFLNRLYAKTKD